MSGVGIARWGYRLWQGFTRLRVTLCRGSIDLVPARLVLPVGAWPLFESLNTADQAHAICVLGHVQQGPGASAVLSQAALLHDVGKAGAGLGLFWRTIGVLLDSVGVLERLASPNPHSWRYPLYRILCHAEHGAELCFRAGCAPEVVALVRWHDSASEMLPEDVSLHDLALLRAADDRC